jgi:hypothetical protein
MPVSILTTIHKTPRNCQRATAEKTLKLPTKKTHKIQVDNYNAESENDHPIKFQFVSEMIITENRKLQSYKTAKNHGSQINLRTVYK